jgi:hypothetical protein
VPACVSVSTSVAWAGSAAVVGDRLTFSAADGLDVVTVTMPAVPPSGCAVSVRRNAPGVMAREAEPRSTQSCWAEPPVPEWD